MSLDCMGRCGKRSALRKYYLYHALSWPQLPQVAVGALEAYENLSAQVDGQNRIVGYVLAKTLAHPMSHRFSKAFSIKEA